MKWFMLNLDLVYVLQIFLQLDPDWCVGRVKEELSLQLGDQGDQQIKYVMENLQSLGILHTKFISRS